jgi:tetratricopeptide (TPR) repeat protein
MLSYLAWSLLIIGCGGVGFIIVRKFPQLSIIKVETVKSEREARTKKNILIKRLKRIRGKWFVGLVKVLSPIGRLIKSRAIKIHDRALHLEKQYKEMQPKKEDVSGVKLETLMEEAEKLVEDENWKDAEQKYLQAVSLDYKNPVPYEGLGDVYLNKKEFKEAKETFEFVAKLNPGKASVYVSLTEAALGLGDIEKAIEYLSTALEIEPNNPKHLDFLIEVGIMGKNYRVARNALDKLREVNPENQKIKDFEIRLKEIGKRA